MLPAQLGPERRLDQPPVVLCSWQQRGLVSRKHGPRPRPTESGINMRYRTSATEHVESTRVSRLRLRVGVLLILLWLIPFWALAPHIAHSLSGLSNPPSVADVTTAIVAVQTILGLLGFWVAGTEVKSIIKGSTMKHALRAIWSILIHGDVRGHDTAGADLNGGQPPREDSR
jgi:hypothetical protein